MDEVLVAEGVRKTYGDVAALDGVSLSVGAGEVIALIGPNGAGKTTLVRALTGTTEPTAGSVSVFGAPPDEVDRSRLGVLPQDFSPPDRLTGRELLRYYAGLYDDALAPGDALELVGLADAADTWYENLSGGQQRRVCLGAALVNDPELLFLDEPTTGIDPAGRRTVAERVEALAARGTTVVLTTHDMAEAERLADRVGLLADGELVAVGPPGELVREHGGDTRLVIEFEASPPATAASTGDTDTGAANDRAESALNDAGYRTAATESELTVYGIEPTEIGAIVDALDDAGADYAALTWREPDLEDVYMALAGDREAATAATDRRGDARLLAGGDR